MPLVIYIQDVSVQKVMRQNRFAVLYAFNTYECLKWNFCVCTDSAQYKSPVFKLKNRVTGKYLAAPASVDADVTHEDAGSNWYFEFLIFVIVKNFKFLFKIKIKMVQIFC